MEVVIMTKDYQNRKANQVSGQIPPETTFNENEVKKDQHKYKRNQHITLDPREK